MTDLEIVKRCAEAMGWVVKPTSQEYGQGRPFRVYDKEDDWVIYGIGDGWSIAKFDPLHDDAQAMALLKKFKVELLIDKSDQWYAKTFGIGSPCIANADLNRAICECVANLEAK